MRRTIEFSFDLSTTFLWAVVAVLVFLGGAREHIWHFGGHHTDLCPCPLFSPSFISFPFSTDSLCLKRSFVICQVFTVTTAFKSGKNSKHFSIWSHIQSCFTWNKLKMLGVG